MSFFESWSGLLLSATALWESAQGRTLFGPTLRFQLWCPGIQENCTSQSLFDPYSVTHLEHGLLFWSALSYAPLSATNRWRAALGAECAWEAVENSEWGVKNYRSKGYPDYRGDSILNSLSDVFCTGLGFLLATQIGSPSYCLLTAALLDAGLELIYGDSLARNILSLAGVLNPK